MLSTLFNNSRFTFAHTGSFFLISLRRILSQSYLCNPQWEQRLSHESFKSVSARDLGISILHSVDSNVPVSPLDYDIFANKLHELDAVSTDFIENVIRKYSQTQSAVQIVESTAHAIVRAFLDFHREDELLKLLSQRAYTGVFLDDVSANLILDRFVRSKAWTSAIQVVWELCLQEYFQSAISINPITIAFALHVSSQLFTSDLPEPDETNSAAHGDPKEVEYKFVSYVRNPNYDNFFDIQRPRLMLGFSLLQMCDLFSKRLDSIRSLSPSARLTLSALEPGLRLFGYAFSEQLSKLTAELAKIGSAEQLAQFGLSGFVLEKLSGAVQSSQTRPEDKSPSRGEPILPSVVDVRTAVEQIERLRALTKQETSEDLFTRIQTFVHNEVFGNEDCMLAETNTVSKLYGHFASERNRIWTEQVNSARQRAIVQQTKQSLRELIDEEERLTYFRNSEDVLHKSWLAPRSRKERRWSRMKEWRQDIIKQREKSEQHSHES